VTSLGDAINLFRCCVFTWNAFTVVLPAFLIGGAIEVLVPSHSVMRYLGSRAHPVLSYGVSAFSGNILTVCSCNVVPIFKGILRRGAGIGPAFTFVFAAPAIHIVNTIMTYKVIGWQLAMWRFISVPIIAIIVGVIMLSLFRREERARQEEIHNRGTIALVGANPGNARRAEMFLGLLMLVLVFGAWMSLDQLLADRFGLAKTVGLLIRMGGVIGSLGLLTLLAKKWFSREEAVEWWRQTGVLAWKIFPIFIPAVFAIALIVEHIPLSWITPTNAQLAQQGNFAFGTPHGNELLPTFVATVFGTLMYFPMLTEVVFTKGLLIERFAVGPALALLLGGPGLSLPGLLLVSRIAGWKKTVTYWAICVVLITTTAYIMGTAFGPYICSCMLNPGKNQ
jgi:uncharacterized membrane protein YraQ (UPF0718 family)